ncbi:hypothetical protein C8R47DRAFT_1240181 [Mycena vitilis]|nr:hypothetical protein C8R47DRAFT_1240181 [Mycena vitilis]
MSDLMNKAKAALSSSGSSGTTGNTGMQGNQAVGGQEDYADKGGIPYSAPSHSLFVANGGSGLDFIEKKQGMTQNRGMNEKITDAAREGYEKVTGNVVSSKISN